LKNSSRRLDLKGFELLGIRSAVASLKNISSGQVANSALALLIGNGVAQVLFSVAVVLTTRHLGVDASGQYLAAYALLGQAAPLLNFGLDTLFLREAGRTPSAIGSHLASISFAKVLLAVGWLPALAFLPPLLSPGVYPPAVMWVAALGIVFQAMGTSAVTAFQGAMRNWVVCWLQVASGGFLLLPIVWLVGRSSALEQFVWVRTGAYVTSAALRFTLAARAYHIRPDGLPLLSLYRDGMPFMAADVLAIIYGTVDVTIVALLLGETAAGHYAPVVTLINTLFLIPLSVYLMAIPLLSQRYTQDPPVARRTARSILGGLTVLGVLLAGGVLIFSPFLSRLVYRSSIPTMTKATALMSGVVFLKSVNYGLVPVLIAVNRQNKRVIAQVASVVTNVGLNLLLVGSYGVIAAALVYVISEAVLCIGLAIYAVPHMRAK